MNIQKIEIKPDTIKENGLFIFNIDRINPHFKVKEKSVVYIPPGEFGGNHKHPRTEAFVSLGGNLKLIWVNENGKRDELMMNRNEKVYLFVIPPNVPHSVVNTSKTTFGVMIEFADDLQHNVEKAELITNLVKIL